MQWNDAQISRAFSKYDGLQMIDVLGLPHPDWRFVDEISQLSETAWVDAPHGWTIRCTPRDCYNFGMPSRHHLQFKDIPGWIGTLARDTGVSVFVIYPSWKFQISGCLFVEKSHAIIEIVAGDIGPLLKGQVSPDTILEIQGPYFLKAALVQGQDAVFSSSEMRVMLGATRVLAREGMAAVLEWARTSDDKFFYFDYARLGTSV